MHERVDTATGSSSHHGQRGRVRVPPHAPNGGTADVIGGHDTLEDVCPIQRAAALVSLWGGVRPAFAA